MASPKLVNCLGFRNSLVEKVGVLCLRKRRPSERLKPCDTLKNKNSLYINDGKQGPSKDKTKGNKLNQKQKKLGVETEINVLILKHKRH